MKPYALDIIIVNYKSTDCLIQCLSSIDADRGAHELHIHIQDNASDGDARQRLAHFNGINLVENRNNLGFGRAVNRSIASSNSEYVILLNPDTTVKKGFFDASLDFMATHPEVGIMGPRILDSDGQLQNSARGFPTPMTALFGRSSVLSRWFPRNPITSKNLLSLQSDGVSPMQVDWVSGACMIIRRTALNQIGAMDERFFMYWEDADLCKRMWQGGWKVIYFPVPCIMHLVGVSSNQLLTRSVYEFHKSSYLLFIKYSQPKHWFIKPIIILALMNRLLVVLLADILRALFVRLHTSPSRLKLPQPFVFERPVKILRFIARLNIGGPAIHVHLLTKGLDPNRFASKLVTGQISPQEGDMSYLFTSSAKKPIIIPELQREINLYLDFRAWLKIFRLLKREKPALIHTHTSKAGTSARLGAILYNLTSFSRVRMVHTFHGHIFEGYFSPFKSYLFVLIERFLASFTDVIIAISDTQKEDLSLRFKIAPPEKFKTIGLGFNLDPFLNASTKKGRFRRSLGVASSTVLVGIIGRLAPIKNHKMFLEAASCFVNRSPDCDVCFIIIGDGELRAELEDYCQQKDLSSKVEFCGWIKEVDEVYADLDVLALTSNNEGTPVSIIEAMAASVAVVATDVGGVHDILGQKEYECGPLGFTICEHGILCAKNDPKGFCNGLQFVIENATAEKNREHRAQQYIQKHFAIERLLNDIDGLYTNLLSASQRKYTYARIPAKSKEDSATCR